MAAEAQVEGGESTPSPGAKQLNTTTQPKDSEIALSIKALQEESLQISELIEMEKNYAVEVIGLLKQLIEPLNIAFHVKPASVSRSDNSITDVVVTPQGMVCIIHDNGTINSRALETLPTEVMMRILVDVVPELKQLLSEKRQKISGRVGMLEKIAREFRKVAISAPSKSGSRASHGSPSPSSSSTLQGQQQQPAVREKSDSRDAMKSVFSEPEK